MASIGIETIIVFGAIFLGIVFPRHCANLLHTIFKRKEYVVIKLKKHNSGFFEKWLRVPGKDHIAWIKGRPYYVPPNYAKEIIGKRLHFLVDEADTIPEYPGRKDEDIIFHTGEMRSSLVNKIAERLFNDKKDMLFYIVAGCCVITVIAVFYSLSQVSRMTTILEQMQAITNNSEIITRVP